MFISCSQVPGTCNFLIRGKWNVTKRARIRLSFGVRNPYGETNAAHRRIPITAPLLGGRKGTAAPSRCRTPTPCRNSLSSASNFSAENRGGGGVVKMTTHSGNNQIHGTLFEFLRNDYMDARDYFELQTEPYKQSQYGGTIGGPIRKDKLFYFGSVQGTNKRGSPNPKDLTLPTGGTAQWRFFSDSPHYH